MIQNHRLALWILLILLTAIILFYPVHLSYEYRAVESPYIFDNLPLFGVLYSTWMALLLILFLSKGKEGKSSWEGMALVAIFALVSLGFWSIIAPNRTDDGLLAAATVNHISTLGTLTGENVFYSSFPGIHLLASSICQITGLEVFDSVAMVLVFNALLLSALLYLLFSKTLKNQYLAIFAVLLVIQGNWYLSLASFLYPGYLGLIFFITFLVLLNRKEDALLGTWQDTLMMIILLAAVTITHFVTSMLFLLVLLGILLVQLISRHRLARRGDAQHEPRIVVDWSIIALCLIVPLAWELYQSVSTFTGIVGLVPKVIEDITEGQLFGNIFLLGTANLGEATPLWANITRWSWFFSIFGFGAILALRNLFRLRRLSSVEKKEIGGLAGIVLLGLTASLLSLGGPEGLRFLLYAPLFIVPIILRFFSNLRSGQEDSETILRSYQTRGGWPGRRSRGYAFIILPILFFALSFPTFLAHNNKISTTAFYPYDFAPGEFLASTYDTGEGLTLFFYGGTAGGVWYYLQDDADYGPVVANVEDEEDLWRQADDAMTMFESSEGQRIFIFSERGKGAYEHLFGVKPSDIRWQQLEQRLQKGRKLFYNNGFVQLYEPE
jgi:hypothetical protein